MQHILHFCHNILVYKILKPGRDDLQAHDSKEPRERWSMLRKAAPWAGYALLSHSLAWFMLFAYCHDVMLKNSPSCY